MAEKRHYTKLFDLENFLRRCGIRNSWQLLDCLVRATPAASEKDIFDRLSRAEFESGHDALKLAEDLGELQALIKEAHSFRDALSDVAAGLRLALDIERQCLDLALQQVNPAVACQDDRRTGGTSADLPKAMPDISPPGEDMMHPGRFPIMLPILLGHIPRVALIPGARQGPSARSNPRRLQVESYLRIPWIRGSPRGSSSRKDR